MSQLFRPITIGQLALKNRIVMSPMCQYSAAEDGKVNDWHLLHYPARAIGGAALLIMEATAVQPNGRITDQDLGIWDDQQVEGLARIAELVHRHGAKIGIQLGHAGRKSRATGRVEAPSAVAFSADYAKPAALSIGEIAQLVENFQRAAIRAKTAGFDVIELHAAHGYLINQFLSPLSNLREDEYGGSAENRFRLLKEIILAVRAVWSGPLFVRVSADEYAEGGNRLEQTVQFAKWMKAIGVDLIDVSSGGVVPVSVRDFPGYQVPFAEKIKQEANVATGAVGLIRTPELAEEILQNGRADLIFLGRELLRQPYWPQQAALELGEEIDLPTQYLRAWHRRK
ncbi:NADPH dehydrogenase NamA [Brevibacillus fulvus]|uniref:NADPH2 dehydrogenase n=1 Tax=Brevibacillus fulvus TaxID=1125967 RepID=A0A939BTL2_9BACL|nr:NADPH dehydrogenase NamA [Brevibacillus fulvus]MBM7588571.1 NADPH2 dehydrogenase [Brevibacillus fulvus]